MKKRVFYFNINYNCDNKCVFCYSHNTIFGDSFKKSLSLKEFKEYAYKYKIGKGDRIILNGGEPLLHREINDYLKYIYLNNLETIIYTNGRNINKLLPIYLESNIRFVVPIHGNQIIHDEITGISGSYSDTINSLKWLKKNGKKVLVDMKIILNNKTVEEMGFLNSLKTWERIDFNNSIHITMMADTLVSQSNGCKTLDKENVSYYTNKLYNVFKNKNKLKIYDTCINSLEILEEKTIEKYNYNIDLHYKDNVLEKKIHLKKNTSYCNKECNLKEFCISEVSEHKVLEIDKDKIYENME